MEIVIKTLREVLDKLQTTFEKGKKSEDANEKAKLAFEYTLLLLDYDERLIKILSLYEDVLQSYAEKEGLGSLAYYTKITANNIIGER